MAECACLNGIYISSNLALSKKQNFEKIKKGLIGQLSSWQRRGLTLLGRILIIKTFGLSQLIYTLTNIVLLDEQMDELSAIIQRFLWKRNLLAGKPRPRIKLDILRKPVALGGFGYVDIKDVIDSIRIKQLFKLTDLNFDHPIAHLTVEEGTYIQTAHKLRATATEAMTRAQNLIKDHVVKVILASSDEDIENDAGLRRAISEIDVREIVKPSKITSKALMALVHKEGCSRLIDVIRIANRKLGMLKVLVKKKWLRIIMNAKDNFAIEPGPETLRTSSGRYKLAHKVSSKEFRELLSNSHKSEPTVNKYEQNLREEDRRAFFKKVTKLKSTKHRNIALRIWNGDVLSNDRLFHMGLTDTNNCPNCEIVETQTHLLKDCSKTKKLLKLLEDQIPPKGEPDIAWTGIYDSVEELELRCECWWYLMNKRSLPPETIHKASLNYINSIRNFIGNGYGDINIDLPGILRM